MNSPISQEVLLSLKTAKTILKKEQLTIDDSHKIITDIMSSCFQKLRDLRVIGNSVIIYSFSSIPIKFEEESLAKSFKEAAIFIYNKALNQVFSQIEKYIKNINTLEQLFWTAALIENVIDEHFQTIRLWEDATDAHVFVLIQNHSFEQIGLAGTQINLLQQALLELLNYSHKRTVPLKCGK